MGFQAEDAADEAAAAKASAEEQRAAAAAAASEAAQALAEAREARAAAAKQEQELQEREAAAAARDSDLRAAHSNMHAVMEELQVRRASAVASSLRTASLASSEPNCMVRMHGEVIERLPEGEATRAYIR